MATIINYTPHPITLRREGRPDLVFPSSGIARCSTTTEITYSIRAGETDDISIDVARNVFGEVSGLPPEQEGTIYIVSFPVLQAMSAYRSDLIGPDTSPAGNPYRDAKGQIVAVRRFQTI